MRWRSVSKSEPHGTARNRPKAEDATALRAAVEHFGITGERDRNELLITHNFVIGGLVRHVLDVPEWRWIGLNLDNCALTVVQWDSRRHPG